jgi:hypothetical protein
VDEVELVLDVVVMVEAVVAGRIHDCVDTESCDAERHTDLAKAVALSELVDRSERVSHSLLLVESCESSHATAAGARGQVRPHQASVSE